MTTTSLLCFVWSLIQQVKSMFMKCFIVILQWCLTNKITATSNVHAVYCCTSLSSILPVINPLEHFSVYNIFFTFQ